MKHNIDKTKGAIGELAGLSAKTEAAEKRILSAAESRLKEVQAGIDRTRSGVEFGPEAARQRYLDLVEERGRLHIVISKARQVLSA